VSFLEQLLRAVEQILRAVCRILELLLRPFCAPPYDPASWDLWTGYVRTTANNNCYNYATDIQTNTFAQPGRAAGLYPGKPFAQQTPPPNCADVGRGAVADGLTPVDCDSGCGCRGCCHRVALVISPGSPSPWADESGEPTGIPVYDYHFYRLDKNGMWSHKPGAGAVTNRDASGNLISDPRTCNRYPYTVFCGCYCVCKSQVRIL
jgi:hypothetical protein